MERELQDLIDRNIDYDEDDGGEDDIQYVISVLRAAIARLEAE